MVGPYECVRKSKKIPRLRRAFEKAEMVMVYEEEPYLHAYLSRWLQAIQLFTPTRGVATATPGYRQGKRTAVKKLSIANEFPF